jgi:hypothetical protein
MKTLVTRISVRCAILGAGAAAIAVTCAGFMFGR